MTTLARPADPNLRFRSTRTGRVLIWILLAVFAFVVAAAGATALEALERLEALESGRSGPARDAPHDQLAAAAVARADWPAAVLHHRHWVRAAPGDSDAVAGLGLALQQIGRENEAIDALERAVRSGGNSPAVWGNLGRAYLIAGRLREAISAYRRLVDIIPDQAVAYVSYAHALGWSGETGEALAVLDLAERLARTSHEQALVLQTRGVQRFRSGEHGEALRHFRKAAECAGARGRAAAHLEYVGLVLVAEGRWEDARAHCLRLAESSDPTARNWFYLWVAEARLGNAAAAARARAGWRKHRTPFDVALLESLVAPELRARVRT